MISDLCYSNLVRTSLTSGNDELLGNDSIWQGSHMTFHDQPLFGECSVSSSHRLQVQRKKSLTIVLPMIKITAKFFSTKYRNLN